MKDPIINEREYVKIIKCTRWIERGLRDRFKTAGCEYIVRDDNDMYMTITNATSIDKFRFDVCFLNRSEDNMGGYLRSFKKFCIDIDTDENKNVCFYVTTKTDHIKLDIINDVIRMFDGFIDVGSNSDTEE